MASSVNIKTYISSSHPFSNQSKIFLNTGQANLVCVYLLEKIISSFYCYPESTFKSDLDVVLDFHNARGPYSTVEDVLGGGDVCVLTKPVDILQKISEFFDQKSGFISVQPTLNPNRASRSEGGRGWTQSPSQFLTHLKLSYLTIDI